MQITYYVVGTLYLILTVLIIWHSIALINVIKVMGERLAKEKKRLRVLMTVFSISYIGTSAYYIIQVATKLNCVLPMECVRFLDLMTQSGVQLCFDVAPIAVLYIQHFFITRESI